MKNKILYIFGSLLCYLIWWDDNDQNIENYVEDIVNGFLN